MIQTAIAVPSSMPLMPGKPAKGGALGDRLARVDGIDVVLALRNVGDHADILARVMRRFAKTYQCGLPTLLDSRGNEYEVVVKWRLACHSLRGALALIGATSLCRKVEELEFDLQQLNSRSTFVPKAREIHESLIALANRIAGELDMAGEKPSVPRKKRERTDPRRLSTLQRMMILDTPPESEFDLVTRRLASTFNAPIAMVNLLDGERDWFKSAVGFDQTGGPATESFCEEFFNTSSDVIVVEDLLKDDRFSRHPYVLGMPFVRFYAASRLVVRGHTVGTICAFDTSPRAVSSGERDELLSLAATVTDLLNARSPEPISEFDAAVE